MKAVMPLENEEEALEPSAPKLFDTPSKPNYHTSTGFGKSSQQTIAVKATIVANSRSVTLVGSSLLYYSIQRQSLPLDCPGSRCRERVRHCQKSKVSSHFDLPPFRRSSRRNKCKADKESRTLYREAPTSQRPARRLLYALHFKSRKGTSCNVCVRSTEIDKADRGRSTAKENAGDHTKRCTSK